MPHANAGVSKGLSDYLRDASALTGQSSVSDTDRDTARGASTTGQPGQLPPSDRDGRDVLIDRVEALARTDERGGPGLRPA